MLLTNATHTLILTYLIRSMELIIYSAGDDVERATSNEAPVTLKINKASVWSVSIALKW